MDSVTDGLLYHSWPQPDGTVRMEFLSADGEAALEVTADEFSRMVSTGTLPLVGVDPDEFYRAGAESLERHAAWTSEFGYRGPKTGRVRWFRGRDFPLRTADGTPYFVGVLIDITAVREAETAAEAGEERLRTMLACGGLLGWDRDPATGTVACTTDSATFHGLTPPGKGPLEKLRVVHPDDRPAVADAVDRALSTGTELAVEYRGLVPAVDGGPRWFASRGRVIRDADGKAVRLVGVTWEETARKRAEDERAKLAAALAEAQRVDSLSVLAGGVAHDFNNLLTIIMGNAALVRAEVGDFPHAEPLAEIEAACKRAAGLCRQMLAYAGRDTAMVRVTDLNRAVADAAGPLATAAGAVPLSLSLSSAPRVAVDPAQVLQLLVNLVRNAAEATPPGGPAVRLITGTTTVPDGDAVVGYKPPPAPGWYAVVEVVDAGVGMTADVQARVFDPFFSTKFAGRGLGMAAVLGIVRGHRGAIRILSAPGRGTAVRVLIPAAETAHPAAR